MNEPKPFASLSSGLLARKGQAKPAMRPQGFASFGAPGAAASDTGLDDLGWNDMGHDRPHVHVALTPMESEHVEAEIVPLHADYEPELDDAEEPVVLQQFEELERSFEPVEQAEEAAWETPVEAPVEAPSFSPLQVKPLRAPVAKPAPAPKAPAPRAAPGTKSRAAFTLRLDTDRHLQLRVASAVAHRSAQALVIEALDAFLAANPQFRELGR